MKIFSFVGNSGGGKTRLLARLVPQLKKRGHAVAVVKHCPHGFSLDPEGKDSRLLFEAGADSVALVSSDMTAIFKRDGKTTDYRAMARHYFSKIDILLIEGGRASKGLRKIEVLREAERPQLRTQIGELIAIVADGQVKSNRPVFRHSQVREISEFLEGQPEEAEPSVSLSVDGIPVPLNAFVQKVSANIMLSLVRSLRGIKDNPKRITFTAIEGGKEDEGN
jgi:molybdopterin-guanine dinucleotide biosynthesis adapter protein